MISSDRRGSREAGQTTQEGQATQAHQLLCTMLASTCPTDFGDGALLAALHKLSEACSASVPHCGAGSLSSVSGSLVASLQAENAALLEEVAELRAGAAVIDAQVLRRVTADNEELARDNEQLQESARGVCEAASAEVDFWRRAAAEQQVQATRTADDLNTRLAASRTTEHRLGTELHEFRAAATNTQAMLASQVATLQRQLTVACEARDTLDHSAEEQRKATEQESSRVADALRRAAGCEREATQLRQEARSLRAQLLRQEDEQAQLQALLLKHEALARSFGAVSSTKESAVAQERVAEHRAELEGELKLKDAELDGLSAKVRFAEVHSRELEAKLEETRRLREAADQQAVLWKECSERQQAQLQAKTKETAQVAIDLAQAQHETLNLRQEQAEMVAQREQAEAEMSERAQRCTDAVENHRQEFEQSKRELQQVRHELEQSQGELEQSKRELQQVRHELEQARGDLENSHRDAEKIRCGATEQEEKLDQVEAELASCREAMAAEQALLKQQIAALQLERDGLQGQIALDNDTMASHAPGKRVTNADNTDLVSGAGNLVPVAQQSQLNMNEGVPRKPTGLTSDVDCQLSAQRIQFSFRLSRLRKRLDEAVAGWDASEALCWEATSAKDELRRQLAAVRLQVQSGGSGISVRFVQEKHDQAVELRQKEHAARLGVEQRLTTVMAEKTELVAKLSREQELRGQTLERLNQVSSTARKKEAHLLRQLQLASDTERKSMSHEAVVGTLAARKSAHSTSQQRNLLARSVSSSTVEAVPETNAREINSDVRGWLKQAALVDYSTALVNAGYDEINTIASLTDSELHEVAALLQMPPGHRKKLQLGAAILRNSRQTQVAQPLGDASAHTTAGSTGSAEAPLQRAKRLHGQAWGQLSSTEKQAALSVTMESREDAAIRTAQEKLLEKEAKLKEEEAILRKAKLHQDALRESELAKIEKLRKQLEAQLLEAQLRSAAPAPAKHTSHVNPKTAADRSRQEAVQMVSALLRSLDDGGLDVHVEDVVRHFDSVHMPARRWVPALQSKQRAGELDTFLESLTAPATLDGPRSVDSKSTGSTEAAQPDTSDEDLLDRGDRENTQAIRVAQSDTNRLDDRDDREKPSSMHQPAHALQSDSELKAQTVVDQISDPEPQSTDESAAESTQPTAVQLQAPEPVPSYVDGLGGPQRANEVRTPSRLVESPFQSLRTRSRVKQQAAGGVLAATLLAGQQLYEVKQSHILRPGVPRTVVLTIGSQAVTLIQSVKTMKPLESYPLQQIKISFRHDKASFTLRVHSQGGRELTFSSEKTIQIEAEIRARLDEHSTIAHESVSSWLERQGISDPQMTEASIRVLKKKTRESTSWSGILQQMTEKDAAYFIQQAASLTHIPEDHNTSSEDEAASSDGKDNAADQPQTAPQKLFGFRDRLPQNLVEAKSLAAKAKESILANMAGDETDSDSETENTGPDSSARSIDPAGLSDDSEAMDYMDSGSDAGTASVDSDLADDLASDFSSDPGSDAVEDFISDSD